MFSDLTTALNPEQAAAVTTRARDALVIAGAGSGKTRVMVQRVARLIRDRGMSPLSIMVLTFTRRAAGEIISRLKDECELSDSDLAPMLVGTFHSVAYRMLRAHGAAIGYNSAPTVVSPQETEDVLRNVGDDLGFRRRGKWLRALSDSGVRSDLERVYFGAAPKNADAAAIIREYHDRMRVWRCLDFGMILMECGRMFREAPFVLMAFRKQVLAVMVDELQDADESQHVMHAWFSPPAEFFGVGDRRQTIYRFRGARPDLMTTRHPGAEVIDLTACFRCGDDIVSAANRLIAHNGGDTERPMVGHTGRRGRLELFGGGPPAIANQLLSWRGLGYRWGDMAVLARRHDTLKRIDDCLRDGHQTSIPFHRVGTGESLFGSRSFRILEARLWLSVNPKDWIAAEVLRAAKAQPRVACEGATLGQAVAELSDDPLSPQAAYWTERFPANTHVADALAAHAMRDAHDDLPPGDAVTLATIHAAKGLEWPCVIIAACEDGELPSALALREFGGVEDERRLMYVAMTRAKERLTLHCGSGFGDGDRRPSRFIGEAGL